MTQCQWHFTMVSSSGFGSSGSNVLRVWSFFSHSIWVPPSTAIVRKLNFLTLAYFKRNTLRVYVQLGSSVYKWFIWRRDSFIGMHRQLSWNGCLKRIGRCVTLQLLHVGFVKSLFSSFSSKMQYLFDLLNDDSGLHYGDVRGNGTILELFGCSEENESRLCWRWRIWLHDRRWQQIRRR